MIDAIDTDIDADLPLLAGRLEPFFTSPHEWRVERVRVVRAVKGEVTVRFDRGHAVVEVGNDEEFDAPRSAAGLRALADLVEQADEIVAAYEAGVYVPPAPLPVWVDNQPRGPWNDWLGGAAAMLMQRSSIMDFFGYREPPLEHRLGNVWRRMQGRDPLPDPPRPGWGSGTGRMEGTTLVAHYD